MAKLNKLLEASSKFTKSLAKRGQRTMSQAGLQVQAYFCPTEVESPFDTAEYDYRTAGDQR